MSLIFFFTVLRNRFSQSECFCIFVSYFIFFNFSRKLFSFQEEVVTRLRQRNRAESRSAVSMDELCIIDGFNGKEKLPQNDCVCVQQRVCCKEGAQRWKLLMNYNER